MAIEFISLKYQYKLTEPVSEREEQRLLALMATHDLAALGYLVRHTAELLCAEELPPQINEAELLQGYGALGRLMSGLANQAIGAIETLGEILERSPGGTGQTFEDDVLELDEETKRALSQAHAA